MFWSASPNKIGRIFGLRIYLFTLKSIEMQVCVVESKPELFILAHEKAV